MRIDRIFTQKPTTTEYQDPYEGINFVERVSKITNANGSVVSEIKNVLVPDNWSQVAVDIMAQKYFRKAGVPARLKKKFEPEMPEWLCPSVPDEETLSQLPVLKDPSAGDFVSVSSYQSYFGEIPPLLPMSGEQEGIFHKGGGDNIISSK